MLRSLSLSVRKLQARKEIKRGLDTFNQWRLQISQLPDSPGKAKKLLIIRLDDIGDYILFRNTLPAYRHSTRWKNYTITLLGNTAWRSLYEYADNGMADTVIWLNKNDYHDDTAYRVRLWHDLRKQGFEVVICPSRARPMLLDDACMLAAAPVLSIGGHNELLYNSWNQLSDSLYSELCADRRPEHEFHWNNAFAAWCTGIKSLFTTPSITAPVVVTGVNKPYIICFIGGSKRSHRWPVEHWITFINDYGRGNNVTFIIAGGKTDEPAATAIASATNAVNMSGRLTLPELAGWMRQSAAVVTNDTMSSHMAISVEAPTLIIANGDNFYKFCGYKEAHIGQADCVYPPVFMHEWKRHNFKPFRHYVAVTADIATISPSRVCNALQQLISK